MRRFNLFGKWIALTLCFIGCLAVSNTIEAKNNNHFTYRDFKGDWVIVGNSVGGVSDSSGLSIALLGKLKLGSHKIGKVYSFLRSTYSGPIGTPLAILNVSEPLDVSIKISDSENGLGVITLYNVNLATGPTTDLPFAFVASKDENGQINEIYLQGIWETSIPDKFPPCVPVLTLKRQFKRI